jgi:hypothetical protein
VDAIANFWEWLTTDPQLGWLMVGMFALSVAIGLTVVLRRPLKYRRRF